MTDGTQDHANGGTGADQAERIASEATDVRERVRRLVLELAGGEGPRLSSLRRAASDVVDGVTRGLKEVGDERQGTVLAETIEGLSDGIARAAHATRLAIEEAEGRGQGFAREDLKQALDDLRTLDRMFMDTVGGLTSRLSEDVRAQVGDLTEHASRALDSMRPSIESAIEAATRHPGEFAGEATSAGVDATRRAVGSLFGAAAGLLDAAGDIVSGRKKDTPGGES